jgi:iron complex outermembrane receptor protein
MALLASIQAFAQSNVISGKVTDSKDGSALSGVTVLAKGTNIGTQTGVDGAFRLSAPAGTNTLVISYVGYATQEVAVGQGPVAVTLVQTSASLNDVVVVAYGTRKKGDLTGAVTSISAKDFQKGNIASPEQLLQGKVAGLEVTTGGGSAGGGSRIRIRGGASLNASNDPLIVIDGVPVDGNSIAGSANYLNTINPNDIESMSVLKDASATALYGSRASNGVIIITTKKGAKGAIKFNFNTQPSLASIDKYVPVLTADQIRTIITNDANATGNNTYKDLLGSSNTDWQKVIFRSAFSLDNNLSASGSIGKIPFRISAGYLNEQGVLKTNSFDRYSTSLSLTPKFLDDHLSINLNVKASQTNNRFADEGAIGAAVSFDPTQPVYAKNNYGGYFEWLQADGKAIVLATRNPLGLLELRNNTSQVQRIIGNVQVDYKVHWFPDLHVQFNLGIDKAGGSGNYNIDSISATNYLTAGRFTYYKQGKTNTLADVSLFYTKDIKSIDSKIDVLALHSYEDFYTNVYNYPSYGQNGVVIPNTIPTFPTDKPEYRIESYLGRMNFTFHNTYLLTASIRSDASSKFSPATRVGYFPAGAFAWKLKEQFFKTSSVVSDLKLRLGYGQTGQQDIGAYYSYLAYYSQSNSSAQYEFGNTYYSFLRPSAYDANRKWESTTTYNAGLDFGFLSNRISGSVDVYDKKTKDLLSVVPIAPGSNFDITLLTNVGNMENKGVEFTLNGTPVKSHNVTWDVSVNATYNSSKITNLLKNPDPNFKGIDVSPVGGGLSNYVGKFIVGYAPYTFYVYKQVYDAKTGKPLDGVFEDLNRDGKIDANDRYLYKKPAPDVLLGFSTQVTYKNWSLSLAGHGSIGNYIYDQYNSNNGVLRALKNPLDFVQNASPDYLNTGFSGSNINEYLSDYYVQNASFIRLDNVAVGYNAGKVFHKQAGLRLLASVQNVFVITKYKGLDPENASDQGTLYTIYPRPRIYALGVNLDF